MTTGGEHIPHAALYFSKNKIGTHRRRKDRGIGGEFTSKDIKLVEER